MRTRSSRRRLMSGGLFSTRKDLSLIENQVKPEIEIFDAGMVYNALYYLKKGFLKAPLHFQFVLGAAGGTAATVENLVYLKSTLSII